MTDSTQTIEHNFPTKYWHLLESGAAQCDFSDLK